RSVGSTPTARTKVEPGDGAAPSTGRLAFHRFGADPEFENELAVALKRRSLSLAPEEETRRSRTCGPRGCSAVMRCRRRHSLVHIRLGPRCRRCRARKLQAKTVWQCRLR